VLETIPTQAGLEMTALVITRTPLWRSHVSFRQVRTFGPREARKAKRAGV
jgi:hypothetical protein